MTLAPTLELEDYYSVLAKAKTILQSLGVGISQNKLAQLSLQYKILIKV